MPFPIFLLLLLRRRLRLHHQSVRLISGEIFHFFLNQKEIANLKIKLKLTELVGKMARKCSKLKKNIGRINASTYTPGLIMIVLWPMWHFQWSLPGMILMNLKEKRSHSKCSLITGHYDHYNSDHLKLIFQIINFSVGSFGLIIYLVHFNNVLVYGRTEKMWWFPKPKCLYLKVC